MKWLVKPQVAYVDSSGLRGEHFTHGASPNTIVLNNKH